jgi:hypothetical protein
MTAQDYQAFVERIIWRYEGGYGWDRNDPGTGIDNVIFVSTKYRGRHAPRIKIAVDPPNKFSATGKNTTMTIHDYATVGEPLPRHIFEQARHFIERNRDALLRYWNEEIDTATFIGQLAPPDTQR